MLIKCYECNSQISDKAGSCPNCGAPVNDENDFITEGNYASEPAIRQQVTTIEKTGKQYKAQLFLSGLLIVGSFFGLYTSSSSLPVMLLFFGILWYIATRIAIFWHHE